MKVSVWPHTTMVLNLTSPEDVLLVSSSTDWDWANLHNFGGFFFLLAIRSVGELKGNNVFQNLFRVLMGEYICNIYAVMGECLKRYR